MNLPMRKMMGACLLALAGLVGGNARAGDAATVFADQGAMGEALFQELAAGSGNLVISPFSLGSALDMTLAGARGDTEKEMRRALSHQTLSREAVAAAYDDVFARIKELNQGITLTNANGLCLAESSGLLQKSYRDLLQKHFAAEIFAAPEAEAVNHWVNQKTNGKIVKLLEAFPANTVCVILNAVYFKGNWAVQFKPTATREGDFHVTMDKTTKVPMMHQTGKFTLVENDLGQAIVLPYVQKDLAMIVMLPAKDDSGKGLAEMISQAATLYRQGRTENVQVTLPKFKLEYSADKISGAYQKLGMKKAFSAAEADFGGMTGQSQPGLIWIHSIVHKAVIEVNEEGSEAAAATAVIMVTKSAMRTPEFRADRPFLFAIVDTKTNATLFLGRVRNPAAK
jgi:serpin B